MKISPEILPSRAELEKFNRQRRTIFYPKTDLQIADEDLRALRAGGATQIPLDFLVEACRESLGATPSAIEPLAEQGTFHRIFRVTINCEEPFIFRVSVLCDHGLDLSLYHDFWVTKRLEAEGIPAGPGTLAVDLSRSVGPYDYAIAKEARGTSLRAFDEDDVALAPRLESLGRYIARIHQFQASGYGWINLDRILWDQTAPIEATFDRWIDYLDLNLDSHVSDCVTSGAITLLHKKQIVSIFDRIQDLITYSEASLLHGDLGNHNIFVEGNEISALIDWEDCLAGDPIFDVAFWGTFHPARRREAFLRGYFSESSIPDDFELRYWIYFLRIALSKTVHRRRFGYTDRPGRLPAADRIRVALERLNKFV